jgi:predicted enzyme related to lactoylglutathione lyase
VPRPARYESAEGSPIDAESGAASTTEQRTRTYLSEVVVDCADPTGLARFYGGLLDVAVVEESPDWAYLVPSVRGAHAHVQEPPTGDGLRIAFQRVPEPRAGKVRLHLDFGVDDLEALAERAVALGGSQLNGRIHEGNGCWIVMADPEGHEFCLVDP